MKALWTLPMLAALMALPARAELVDQNGEGCRPPECGGGDFDFPDLPRDDDDDVAVKFGATMDQPLLVVRGDFDGDGLRDTVQGFPDASGGAGRVDVFWGTAGFKVAWPTVLSAVKDPLTHLASGHLGAALAVDDFNDDGFDDLAIGAPHTDLSSHTNAGNVVVIYGCGAPACQAVTSTGAGAAAVASALDPSLGPGALRIFPSPRVDFGRFGKSLAAGDFDNDGYDDLAIGAPGDTVRTATGAGSVTIIHGGPSGLDLNTRQLIHQDLLPAGASRAEADDHFGAALGAARLDPDDYEDLVVGVPDEDWGVEVNPGEVDVFWGGATGISASRYVSFRHKLAMAGANRSGDRLGYDLRALNPTFVFPGRVVFGLAEAALCSGSGGYLRVTELRSAAPVVHLHCAVDITHPASVQGDGALPEIPVKFIVIANIATSPRNPGRLPTAGWSGADPITGAAISGADYFRAQVDLLNQQVRAEDGNPVCDGKDCLRFTYRSHVYYSRSMFDRSGVNVCPMLHAISDPLHNIIGEDARAITDDCNGKTCPLGPDGSRFKQFSDFAEEAVDECSLLTDEDALNIIIYDVCGWTLGSLDCANSKGGRGRKNQSHPYAFLDYDRTLLPRNPATAAPQAAEEHEAGHAFGLNHACDPGSGNTTHIMQSASGCGVTGGNRNLGFASSARNDVNGTSVVEVDMLIQTAREHVKAWQR